MTLRKHLRIWSGRREQLYVGLSRARSLLVVVVISTLLEEAGGRD